jgi:hypothetical protein
MARIEPNAQDPSNGTNQSDRVNPELESAIRQAEENVPIELAARPRPVTRVGQGMILVDPKRVTGKLEINASELGDPIRDVQLNGQWYGVYSYTRPRWTKNELDNGAEMLVIAVMSGTNSSPEVLPVIEKPLGTDVTRLVRSKDFEDALVPLRAKAVNYAPVTMVTLPSSGGNVGGSAGGTAGAGSGGRLSSSGTNLRDYSMVTINANGWMDGLSPILSQVGGFDPNTDRPALASAMSAAGWYKFPNAPRNADGSPQLTADQAAQLAADVSTGPVGNITKVFAQEYANRKGVTYPANGLSRQTQNTATTSGNTTTSGGTAPVRSLEQVNAALDDRDVSTLDRVGGAANAPQQGVNMTYVFDSVNNDMYIRTASGGTQKIPGGIGYKSMVLDDGRHGGVIALQNGSFLTLYVAQGKVSFEPGLGRVPGAPKASTDRVPVTSGTARAPSETSRPVTESANSVAGTFISVYQNQQTSSEPTSATTNFANLLSSAGGFDPQKPNNVKAYQAAIVKAAGETFPNAEKNPDGSPKLTAEQMRTVWANLSDGESGGKVSQAFIKSYSDAIGYNIPTSAATPTKQPISTASTNPTANEPVLSKEEQARRLRESEQVLLGNLNPELPPAPALTPLSGTTVGATGSQTPNIGTELFPVKVPALSQVTPLIDPKGTLFGAEMVPRFMGGELGVGNGTENFMKWVGTLTVEQQSALGAIDGFGKFLVGTADGLVTSVATAGSGFYGLANVATEQFGITLPGVDAFNEYNQQVREGVKQAGGDLIKNVEEILHDPMGKLLFNPLDNAAIQVANNGTFKLTSSNVKTILDVGSSAFDVLDLANGVIKAAGKGAPGVPSFSLDTTGLNDVFTTPIPDLTKGSGTPSRPKNPSNPSTSRSTSPDFREDAGNNVVKRPRTPGEPVLAGVTSGPKSPPSSVNDPYALPRPGASSPSGAGGPGSLGGSNPTNASSPPSGTPPGNLPINPPSGGVPVNPPQTPPGSPPRPDLVKTNIDAKRPDLSGPAYVVDLLSDTKIPDSEKFVLKNAVVLELDGSLKSVGTIVVSKRDLMNYDGRPGTRLRGDRPTVVAGDLGAPLSRGVGEGLTAPRVSFGPVATHNGMDPTFQGATSASPRTLPPEPLIQNGNVFGRHSEPKFLEAVSTEVKGQPLIVLEPPNTRANILGENVESGPIFANGVRIGETYIYRVRKADGTLGTKLQVKTTYDPAIVNETLLGVDAKRAANRAATEYLQTRSGTNPADPNGDGRIVSAEVNGAVYKVFLNINDDATVTAGSVFLQGVSQSDARILKPEFRPSTGINIAEPRTSLATAKFDYDDNGLFLAPLDVDGLGGGGGGAQIGNVTQWPAGEFDPAGSRASQRLDDSLRFWSPGGGIGNPQNGAYSQPVNPPNLPPGVRKSVGGREFNADDPLASQNGAGAASTQVGKQVGLASVNVTRAIENATVRPRVEGGIEFGAPRMQGTYTIAEPVSDVRIRDVLASQEAPITMGEIPKAPPTLLERAIATAGEIEKTIAPGVRESVKNTGKTALAVGTVTAGGTAALIEAPIVIDALLDATTPVVRKADAVQITDANVEEQFAQFMADREGYLSKNYQQTPTNPKLIYDPKTKETAGEVPADMYKVLTAGDLSRFSTIRRSPTGGLESPMSNVYGQVVAIQIKPDAAALGLPGQVKVGFDNGLGTITIGTGGGQQTTVMGGAIGKTPAERRKETIVLAPYTGFADGKGIDQALVIVRDQTQQNAFTVLQGVSRHELPPGTIDPSKPNSPVLATKAFPVLFEGGERTVVSQFVAGNKAAPSLSLPTINGFVEATAGAVKQEANFTNMFTGDTTQISGIVANSSFGFSSKVGFSGKPRPDLDPPMFVALERQVVEAGAVDQLGRDGYTYIPKIDGMPQLVPASKLSKVNEITPPSRIPPGPLPGGSPESMSPDLKQIGPGNLLKPTNLPSGGQKRSLTDGATPDLSGLQLDLSSPNSPKKIANAIPFDGPLPSSRGIDPIAFNKLDFSVPAEETALDLQLDRPVNDAIGAALDAQEALPRASTSGAQAQAKTTAEKPLLSSEDGVDLLGQLGAALVGKDKPAGQLIAGGASLVNTIGSTNTDGVQGNAPVAATGVILSTLGEITKNPIIGTLGGVAGQVNASMIAGTKGQKLGQEALVQEAAGNSMGAADLRVKESQARSAQAGATIGIAGEVLQGVAKVTGSKEIGYVAQATNIAAVAVPKLNNGIAGDGALSIGTGVLQLAGAIVPGKAGQFISSGASIVNNVVKIAKGGFGNITGGIGGIVSAIAGFVPGVAGKVMEWIGLGLTALTNPVSALIAVGMKFMNTRKGALGDHAADMKADFNGDGVRDLLTIDNDKDVKIKQGFVNTVQFDTAPIKAQPDNRGSAVTDGLAPGQFMTSPNGKYATVLTKEGMLAVFEQGADADSAKPIWTMNAATPNGVVAIQNDGRLAALTESPRGDGMTPIWKTPPGATGEGPHYLQMQDDGNLVLIKGTPGNPAGVAWSSAGGHAPPEFSEPDGYVQVAKFDQEGYLDKVSQLEGIRLEDVNNDGKLDFVFPDSGMTLINQSTLKDVGFYDKGQREAGEAIAAKVKSFTDAPVLDGVVAVNRGRAWEFRSRDGALIANADLAYSGRSVEGWVTMQRPDKTLARVAIATDPGRGRALQVNNPQWLSANKAPGQIAPAGTLSSPQLAGITNESATALVTQAYQEVLGRAPDSGGLAANVNALTAGALSITQVRENLLNSAERQTYLASQASATAPATVQATAPAAVPSAAVATPPPVNPQIVQADAQITQAYQEILGRIPDEGGLVSNRNALLGGTSLDQVRVNLLGSAERQTYLNNQLTAMYKEVLRRDPDAGGLAANLASVNGGAQTLTQIRQNLLESTERKVVNAYQDLLNRAPDPAGLQYWWSLMNSGQMNETQMRAAISESALIEKRAA